MRLLTKTTLYYVLSTLGIFILGGVIFYLVLVSIIDKEIDEKLTYKKERVLQKLQNKSVISSDSTFAIDNNIHISSADNLLPTQELYQDTMIFNPLEGEYLPYRQLTTTQQIHGKAYVINIREPLVESESLTEGIVYSLIALFIILILVLIAVNYRISNQLWVPFYQALSRLKNYEITESGGLQLKPTNVREFDELNTILNQMTNRLQQDYQNLKEFTENVSHEIQTPLAIIKSKLELMVQSENIDEEQMRLVQSSFQAANRLSKLNQSLILLAKIENKEFHDIETVSLQELVVKHLEYFEELIDLREISVQTDFQANPTIRVNPLLGDILISNLLSNAIKHNVERGKIQIELDEHQLRISNTGESLSKPPSQLFKRFSIDGNKKDSTGLGLAIVGKICELFDIDIDYSVREGLHILRLSF